MANDRRYFTKRYDWDNINMAEVEKARNESSRLISLILINNTKLLKEAGITLLKMVRYYQEHSGIKLNPKTLSRLKCKKYKGCSTLILGYISAYWNLDITLFLDPNFDAKAVYESLSIKPVRSVKGK